MYNDTKIIDDDINKLGSRYSKSSKIFLVISILFFIWIIFVALGSFVLGLEPNWTLLKLENWVIIGCVLVVIFIILEVIFYYHYTQILDRTEIKRIPQSEELLHGKQLYIYTHPEGSKGGIFCKTYIPLDENTVLRLRELIIPAIELWDKIEEKN